MDPSDINQKIISFFTDGCFVRDGEVAFIAVFLTWITMKTHNKKGLPVASGNDLFG